MKTLFVARVAVQREGKGGVEGKKDSRGHFNRLLVNLAGTSPYAVNTISGTNAIINGLEENQTYLFTYKRRPDEGYGEQYEYPVVKKLDVIETAQMIEHLGEIKAFKQTMEELPQEADVPYAEVEEPEAV